MIMILTVLHILGSIIILININTKNVDKISEISNKVNVSCEVNTNQCLRVTVNKIVE